MSSKDFGTESVVSRASRHATGDVVAPCEMDAVGLIERDSNDWVMVSKDAML